MREALRKGGGEVSDNEFFVAVDICDKFDFFQGQRAGRELWSKKPVDIQNEDIEQFSKDVAFLKGVLCKQKSLIEAQKMDIEQLRSDIINAICNSDHVAMLYEEEKRMVEHAITKAKAEAIKRHNEKCNDKITEIYNNFIFGNNDLEDEEKEAIMDFCNDLTREIDNLVKEMVGENDDR